MDRKIFWIGLLIIFVIGSLPLLVTTHSLNNLLDKSDINLINSLWSSGVLTVYFIGVIFIWMIYFAGKRKKKEFPKFVKTLSWDVMISYSTASFFYVLTRTSYNTFVDNFIFASLLELWSLVWFVNKKV